MKKAVSWLFALLGVAILCFAAVLSFRNLNAPVKLVGPADAAAQCSEEVMSALCSGNLAAAGERMVGSPSLGSDKKPAYDLSEALWESFVSSLSYEFRGDCYASGSGVARDVTVTGVDIPGVTAALGQRAQGLLEQAAEGREDAVDESGSYREEFVMAVLRGGIADILQEEDHRKHWDLSLKLVHSDGRWLVVPEQELIRVFSGGMTD